jgi:Fe-S cluster biogenesis protein NfuA
MFDSHESKNEITERTSSSDETTKTVVLYIQNTPNPNAKKFITNFDVKMEGKISYSDLSHCEHVPLASALLRLANITQVHFFENVLTITQNGASQWEDLEKVVGAVIKEMLPQHNPQFDDKTPKISRSTLAELNPEVALVEEILDRTIRPGLQADGGDVEIIELEGNILTVQYQGACGGCPSSTLGTLQAIESILRTEFNPYLEVVAV